MIQNIFDGIYIVLQYLKGISSEFIVNSFLFVIFPAIKHTGIGGNRKFQKCSIQKKSISRLQRGFSGNRNIQFLLEIHLCISCQMNTTVFQIQDDPVLFSLFHADLINRSGG